MRIDRWLSSGRICKSRSAAAVGDKVHLNGERVKSPHAVESSDMLTFTRGSVDFDCAVAVVQLHRVPASESARCYGETAASRSTSRTNPDTLAGGIIQRSPTHAFLRFLRFRHHTGSAH